MTSYSLSCSFAKSSFFNELSSNELYLFFFFCIHTETNVERSIENILTSKYENYHIFHYRFLLKSNKEDKCPPWMEGLLIKFKISNIIKFITNLMNTSFFKLTSN